MNMEKKTQNKCQNNIRIITDENQIKTLERDQRNDSPIEVSSQIIEENPKRLNRISGEDGKNQVVAGTLNKTRIADTKKTRKNKFVYVSLAILFGKQANPGDKMIIRHMRIDKLPDNFPQVKRQFKIKKVVKSREKAAKIVQAWWRETKEKYNRMHD